MKTFPFVYVVELIRGSSVQVLGVKSEKADALALMNREAFSYFWEQSGVCGSVSIRRHLSFDASITVGNRRYSVRRARVVLDLD